MGESSAKSPNPDLLRLRPRSLRREGHQVSSSVSKAGEKLDGEGGYCLWGKQVPAKNSLRVGALPIGLANHVGLKRDIAEGEELRWQDVDYDENSTAVRVRRELETSVGLDQG